MAANVSSNDVITLCMDKDTTLWNGNEKWIEVDKVSAANGNGSYTFSMPDVASGSYYVGGYIYNKSTYAFITSHLTQAIIVPAQVFIMAGPTSGTYASGNSVTFTWAAANVTSSDVVTLCLDKDTTFWNGNEKWIEIDNVSAATGNGSFTFNMPDLDAGTYYVGGYMYDKATRLFTYSHVLQSITITNSSSLAVSGNASSLILGSTVAQAGIDGASLANNSNTLAITAKELVFSAEELTSSRASQRLTDTTGTDNQDGEELLVLTYRREDLSAIDTAFQDQGTWVERASANMLA